MSTAVRILIDLAILASFAVPMVVGFFRGFVKSVLHFFRFFIAFWLALLLARAFSVSLSPIVAFVAFFVFSLLLFPLLTLVVGKVVDRLPVIKQADRVLGLAFGVLTGLMTAWLLTCAVCMLLSFLEVDYSSCPEILFFRDVNPVPGLLQKIF